MKYRIETKIAGGDWVQSLNFPKEYNKSDALALAENGRINYYLPYRVVEAGVPEPVPLAGTVTQKHYAELNPEPISVIEGWNLGYSRGNAIKYIARAGKKDQSKEGTIKDLEKAISYLKREINAINGIASW